MSGLNMRISWGRLAATLLSVLLSACASPSASSQAGLSGLTISPGSLDQAFRADQYNYTATVPYTTTSLAVTALLAASAETRNEANAQITVNDEIVTSGSSSSAISLVEGPNTIDVVVTAEDGVTTATYTIVVTRAAISSDAQASSITLSAGRLDQLFDPALTSYTADVGYLQTSVQVTVDAYAGASVMINGIAASPGNTSAKIPLDEGLNTISMTITAEDGVTSETYTLEINRQSANNFAQQAYLKASNSGAGDTFGDSVSLSGDTLAVGAPGEDSAAIGIDGDQANNNVSASGALYVFE
jgi:hypothetical protein